MKELSLEARKFDKGLTFTTAAEGVGRLSELLKESGLNMRKQHDAARQLDPSLHPVSGTANLISDLITKGDPYASRKKLYKLENDSSELRVAKALESRLEHPCELTLGLTRLQLAHD